MCLQLQDTETVICEIIEQNESEVFNCFVKRILQSNMDMTAFV